jgi:phosphomannomutase
MPVGYANGLNRLEELVEKAPLRRKISGGRVLPMDGKTGFLDFVKPYHHPSIARLKLAVDCSNGMAGYVVRDILGDQPYYYNEQPDGRFPNHDPNPLKKENQRDVQAAVLSEGLDAGVIYDGDADRVVFIDDKGRFVSPDLLIALLGHYFLVRSGERVLQDIRSSRSVKEYLDAFGAEVHTWKVGRAFACPRLRELDGLYGGEFAGHYYFRDFYYSDSAMIATLAALEVVARFRDQGMAFSGIIDNICRYSSSGELNYHIEKKKEAIEAVAGHFIAREAPLDRMDFDGTRLDYADWWVNIRPSNTEPYLRVILEARTPDLLKDKMDAVQGILKAYQQE